MPNEARHEPLTEILPVVGAGEAFDGAGTGSIATDVPNSTWVAPKVLWAFGAALTAVIAVVTVLLVGTSDEAAQLSAAAVAESIAVNSASSSVSGSLEDWLSAVCRPGTFYDGLGRSSGIFQGARAGSFCQGTDSQIFILRYQSDYLLKNDLLRGGQAFRYYASGVQDHDTVVFVPLGDNVGDVQQLADFGFAIATVR